MKHTFSFPEAYRSKSILRWSCHRWTYWTRKNPACNLKSNGVQSLQQNAFRILDPTSINVAQWLSYIVSLQLPPVFYKAYFISLRQGFNRIYSTNISFMWYKIIIVIKYILIQILLDVPGHGLTVDTLLWASQLMLSYEPHSWYSPMGLRS